MTIFRRIALAILLTAITLPAQAETSNQIYIAFGEGLAPRIQARVAELLRKVPGTKVEVVSDSTRFEPEVGSWVMIFGDLPMASRWVSRSEIESLGSEGFIVKSVEAGGVHVIVAGGNPAREERSSITYNRGLAFAAYEVLQNLGFQFFHPMAPHIPSSLQLDHDLNIREHPRWPFRCNYLHTVHPIELSHFLNGWGIGGPSDVKSWQSMFSEWDLYLEWLIAHRQNATDWAILADKKYLDFIDSTERQSRLSKMVDAAHQWGLLAGIDVGIVMGQQNDWRLLRDQKNDQADVAQIRAHTDWVMRTGADFLSTEMGKSEFEAVDARKMLLWMNTLDDEVESHFNRPVMIKAHVSIGQQVKGYIDPDTGKPINFNFLVHFADPRIVLLPHTVQIYGLDDPAPTYGNPDFSEIHRYLSMETGARPVVWFPESTYWVSYDIDTPLFLPIYAERRLHDLRLLASEENAGVLGRGVHKGSSIQGQMLFTSGWEWGYWLNALVAAHGSWNPHVELDDETAWKTVLGEIFRGSDRTTRGVIDALNDTVKAQNELLIHGKIQERKPKFISYLSGIAYFSGEEVWDDLNNLLAERFGLNQLPTQPLRVGPRAFRKSITSHDINYGKDLEPLLAAMESSNDRLSTEFANLLSNRDSESSFPASELQEFADGAKINALRSTQVHGLYDAGSTGAYSAPDTWFQMRLQIAKSALDQARDVVAEREKNYRVDPERIGGWIDGPTVYRYGYLWTAHSLYYWWRDEGLVTRKPKTVCFLNIINPADDIFPEGQKNCIYKAIRFIVDVSPWLLGDFEECVNPSTQEPNLPARVRPN